MLSSEIEIRLRGQIMIQGTEDVGSAVFGCLSLVTEWISDDRSDFQETTVIS